MLCIEKVVGIDGHGSGTPKIQIYYMHKVKLPKLAFLPSYFKTYPFWKIFLIVNELGRFILLYAFLNELKKNNNIMSTWRRQFVYVYVFLICKKPMWL